MRELHELTDVDDPAWPGLRDMLTGGRTEVRIPPCDPGLAAATLLQLQVTAGSNLGAIALHCGGLLVDDGWLRVYGSPAGDAPGLARVNRFPSSFDPEWRPAAGLVVAHDAIGGTFVLNGPDPRAEGRPGDPGEVVYFAPDTLDWSPLGAGHSAWLRWLTSQDLDTFYDGLRWDGWRDELRDLPSDQGIAVYPFLWSAEGREDVAATSRRAVPMAELLGFAGESCHQLGAADPGFLGAV